MNKSSSIARHGSVVFLALLMTGCNLQPHYQRPALPIANHWNSQKVDLAGNTSDIGWKEFFDDPVMQSLIQQALENNRDMRVAALNVEKAQAQFRVQRSALMPTINISGTETAEYVPGNLYSTKSTGPAAWHQYEAGAGISAWELDFFGRLRSLRDVEMETYLSTRASTRATRLSLVSDVATAYLTLCADNDLLRLASSTLYSQSQSLVLTQKMYRTGTSDAQAVMQAETSVKSAAADVEKYQRQVAQDTNALRLLVGTQLPKGILSHASLDKQWQFPALPAGLPSDLLTHRPDIMAAEHTLKAANADIGAARAAFFPSISLTTFGGSASSSLNNLFDSGTAYWNFIPTITLPIFDGGKNQANLDIAQITKRIDIANYEKSIQQAFKEVNDALAGQATWHNELLAREQDTAASQQYYALAQARFRAGVDNYLNVLVAQRSLYQSQQTQISTRLSTLSQQITLYKVLGGGWKA